MGPSDLALPTWIERLPPRPRCDVPWLGRSVILSDGAVSFCCYSEAVVGNVKEKSLQEIWRGDVMNRIRASLANQNLPPECQSNSCPIYRGDQHSYLLDRMDGPREGPDGPRAKGRQALRASRLEMPSRVARGERLRVDLNAAYTGDWLALDGFVEVTQPDGTQFFLPERDDYPVPCVRHIELSGRTKALSVTVLDTVIDAATPVGTHEICAALFLADSNPSVAANCLWSARGSLVIG